MKLCSIDIPATQLSDRGPSGALLNGEAGVCSIKLSCSEERWEGVVISVEHFTLEGSNLRSNRVGDVRSAASGNGEMGGVVGGAIVGHGYVWC